MRWICLFSLLALAGCTRTPNTFVVDDAQERVRSATLTLCGSDTPLESMRNRFEASVPITCEGEGRITLVYRDGGTEVCPIGYVTSGAEQHFRFRAEQSSCSPIP
jgi:hypothetical protein